MNNLPILPAAYRLIHLAQVDSLRDHVQAMAIGGAEEGTVILADRVQYIPVVGESHRVPDGDCDNLHAALVLEPEFPSQRDHETLFVALVSLANAIAIHASPMTVLRFGWPNEIRIAHYRIGSVWLDHGESLGRRWLTVTLTVNVASTSQRDAEEEMSLHQGDGNTRITSRQLFESWTREFIRWINRWDDRGFSDILAQWVTRADVVGCPVSIRQPDGILAGTGDRIDGEGCLVIRQPDRTESRLSPRIFMGWDSPHSVRS